jgi:uncharacterized protein
MTVVDVETPGGPARVHLEVAARGSAGLVLGHGAAGGVAAPDLVAASEAARSAGVSVALVEQPYRVAGRRSPPRAPQLDAAWIAVIERLREAELARLSLVVGGRSMGARVACRTAERTGAVAVMCLAFPLRPPRRAGKPEAPTHLPELEALRVPVLIVQGERDRFGIPPSGPQREVVTVPGDHGLKSDPEAVTAAVRGWLPAVTAAAVS